MAKKSADTAQCYRHPTRTARRRCYHCRKPICPECQERREGHIFCSEHCAAAQRRNDRLRRLADWNRTALKGTWFRVILFGGLILAGAGAVWLSSQADRFIAGPEVPLPRFHRFKEKGLDYEKINWDEPGAVAIDWPEQGSVVKVSKIRVAGKAPPEAMVGLYVNGQKVDVQMAPKGKWSFEGVPLTEARNVIQARYFDNRGASSYSPAVLVELQAKPERWLGGVEIAATEPSVSAAAPTGPTSNLIRGPTGRREVFLTFDGGSNANSTPAILDTLKREGIHATVFLTGEYMQRYPDLVRRITDEGHLVGNHTFSHPHLTTYSFNGRQSTLSGVTEEFLKSQLQRAADLYHLITGKNMAPYWRAPFGEFNGEILRWAQSAGYRHVYWTPHLDTLDWVASEKDPLFRTPQQILAGLLKRAAAGPDGVDGGIVLMHLGTERENGSRADTILPTLIEDWKARGYTFGTVDEAGK
jgi:peptidoglycan/xylan/chitin deacetylase (PgdA/CDA1 family)